MMEIKSRAMTIEEQFFKTLSNGGQPATAVAKISNPVTKPGALSAKPELAEKQLYSSDFATKASTFLKGNYYWVISMIAIIGVGAVWVYKAKKNSALADSAAKLANKKEEEQTAKKISETRSLCSVVEEQLYQDLPNDDFFNTQINRDWIQPNKNPI